MVQRAQQSKQLSGKEKELVEKKYSLSKEFIITIAALAAGVTAIEVGGPEVRRHKQNRFMQKIARDHDLGDIFTYDQKKYTKLIKKIEDVGRLNNTYFVSNFNPGKKPIYRKNVGYALESSARVEKSLRSGTPLKKSSLDVVRRLLSGRGLKSLLGVFALSSPGAAAASGALEVAPFLIGATSPKAEMASLLSQNALAVVANRDPNSATAIQRACDELRNVDGTQRNIVADALIARTEFVSEQLEYYDNLLSGDSAAFAEFVARLKDWAVQFSRGKYDLRFPGDSVHEKASFYRGLGL